MKIPILQIIGAMILFAVLWWAAGKLLSELALTVVQVVLVVIFVYWVLGAFGVVPAVTFQ